ncbi:synaptobrevin-domain-containing protein [Radiomyces spectabilis]|uniref:synaptobrevin-domain-containing protein n=1 Tax=Radiomyces spectabilis TaxID=64574 RepID=UPI0022206B4C|nr:synaptobrevin-domain-containing protein [Radiomyces spectabilis]KAI8379570.1 synaptobrevin-domain-containing protein [Radiomyces spectabilis]
MSDPYDPYPPNSPVPAPEGQHKTGRVQQQVDDVVHIMQDNIDKVMKRGERLDDLRGKTEDLQSTSTQFRRGANQVRKRMWWKDFKWRIIIGVIILVILGVIIGSIVGTQVHKKNQQDDQSQDQQQQQQAQPQNQQPQSPQQNVPQDSQPESAPDPAQNAPQQ